MARQLRLEVSDGSYHVWNRGVNRADIVFDDRDRQFFMALLPEVIRRLGWILHQFTLMTNHFHIVLTTPDPTLSRGLKGLEQRFAEHINRRYDRCGPLFQERFKSQLVEKGPRTCWSCSHEEVSRRPRSRVALSRFPLWHSRWQPSP